MSHPLVKANLDFYLTFTSVKKCFNIKSVELPTDWIKVSPASLWHQCNEYIACHICYYTIFEGGSGEIKVSFY